MKARIRKTGEIVEIISYDSSRDRDYVLDYVSYIDSNGVKHNKELLNFYCDFELIVNKDIDEVHWQDVRERAAIAAMQGLVSNICESSVYEDIASEAVRYADALVKQLKEHNNETN